MAHIRIANKDTLRARSFVRRDWAAIPQARMFSRLKLTDIPWLQQLLPVGCRTTALHCSCFGDQRKSPTLDTRHSLGLSTTVPRSFSEHGPSLSYFWLLFPVHACGWNIKELFSNIKLPSFSVYRPGTLPDWTWILSTTTISTFRVYACSLRADHIFLTRQLLYWTSFWKSNMGSIQLR
jgi:hypothetical protein